MSLSSRPFLKSVFEALNCSENDYAALFALCLLYALGHNEGKIVKFYIKLFNLICVYIVSAYNLFNKFSFWLSK